MNTSASDPLLEPSIAFALLAAGGAQRFGGRKLLADLGGRPLWRWAAASAESAGFATRILVVPEGDGLAGAFDAEGWSVSVNGRWREGIASSIRLACEIAGPARRLVIALADMPFIEPVHLRSLAVSKGAAFTGYPGGRRGVPAAFPHEDFAALAALHGDRGAGALAWTANAASIAPTWPESLLDIDTADDLDRARVIAGG